MYGLSSISLFWEHRPYSSRGRGKMDVIIEGVFKIRPFRLPTMYSDEYQGDLQARHGGWGTCVMVIPHMTCSEPQHLEAWVATYFFQSTLLVQVNSDIAPIILPILELDLVLKVRTII